jgi:7,8-dihydropterin-6-yl-methyl-4-(beta-D-ribofuranosyl)aminobenzene 5'-phosphate synthase
MSRHALFTVAAMIASAAVTAASPGYAQSSTGQITVLYDAFGKDAAMRKDWGFSALVEVAGKRILFDTGDDRDIFAANVKAKGVDLNNLDFVVLSHRHSDHMAGLSHVLSVNPKVKIYAPTMASAAFTVHRFLQASIARIAPCRRRCATTTAGRQTS